MVARKKTTKRPGKKTGRPKGRRSRIHDRGLVEAVVSAVEKGHSFKVAALKHGLGEATLHEWRSRGSQALEAARTKLGADATEEELLGACVARERPYAVFAERITRARAVAEAKLLDYLHTIAELSESGDAYLVREGRQAAQWLLERTRRAEYGPGQRIELEGSGGVKFYLPEPEGDDA